VIPIAFHIIHPCNISQGELTKHQHIAARMWLCRAKVCLHKLPRCIRFCGLFILLTAITAHARCARHDSSVEFAVFSCYMHLMLPYVSLRLQGASSVFLISISDPRVPMSSTWYSLHPIILPKSEVLLRSTSLASPKPRPTTSRTNQSHSTPLHSRCTSQPS